MGSALIATSVAAADKVFSLSSDPTTPNEIMKKINQKIIEYKSK